MTDILVTGGLIIGVIIVFTALVTIISTIYQRVVKKNTHNKTFGQHLVEISRGYFYSVFMPWK